MNTTKLGESNFPKGDAAREHPERAGQLGANWAEENQGNAPQGPGPRDRPTPIDTDPIKKSEGEKK